jgi:hypothetical protein
VNTIQYILPGGGGGGDFFRGPVSNKLFVCLSICSFVCCFDYLFGQIFGIVNSTNEFQEQHLVMNGCSDLLLEVFGKDIGFHARSAIGTNTLPLGVSVEIEAIVQIKPE